MAKRPHDPVQLAKKVFDIAIGEAEDTVSESKRHPSAKRKRGLKGGKARAKRLTPAERSDIARLYRVNRNHSPVVLNLLGKRVGQSGKAPHAHSHREVVPFHVGRADVLGINYNFARIHKTLRITPSMAAGLSDHVWSVEEIRNDGGQRHSETREARPLQEERQNRMITWKSRLRGIGTGIILILGGYLRLRAGIQVVTTSRMQPMFSFGLIAVGLVLIIASSLPVSLVSRMTATRKH